MFHPRKRILAQTLRNFSTFCFLLAVAFTGSLGHSAPNLSFNHVEYSEPIGYPNQLLAQDLNGDTKPDLVVSSATSVSIHLNDGAGKFLLGPTYAVDWGNRIALADLNGDSKSDIVALGDYQSLIFLGDGTGHFTPPPSPLMPQQLGSFAIEDLNGDNKLDLVSAYSNQLTLRLGNGDGTFQPGTTIEPGPHHIVGLATGDFNGDDHLDLAGTCYSDHKLLVMLGDGAGNFSSTYEGYGEKTLGSVLCEDFNNDTKLDLVVAAGASGVYLLPGDGAGHFGDAVLINPAMHIVDVRKSDLNSDGFPDFYTVPSYNDAGFAAFLNDGTGHFTSNVYGAAAFPRSVSAADFDGDGHTDFAAISDSRIYLLKASVGYCVPGRIEFTQVPLGIVAADFNSDNKPDLALTANESTSVLIRLGDGSGGFVPAAEVDANAWPRAEIATGDFNRDFKTDLAVLNTVQGHVAMLLGNGDGTFISPATFATGPEPLTMKLTDVNNDENLDVVVRNDASQLTILLGNGTGVLGTPVALPLSSPAAMFEVEDFNNDQMADITLMRTGTSVVSLLKGNADTSFQEPRQFAIPYYSGNAMPPDMMALDAIGSGLPDLIAQVEHCTPFMDWFTCSYPVVCMRNDGAGGFYNPQVISYGAASFYNSDLNGEGTRDLVIARSAIAVLPTSFAGDFQREIVFGAGGQSERAAIADFNIDNKPDVAVLNNATSGVTLLINTTGAPTDNVVVADLDATSTVSAQAPFLGGQFTYTIQVTNHGPGISTDTMVTNQLPAKCSLVTASESQGSHSVNGNTIVFALGTLAAGAKAEIHIVATAIADGVLNNTASVSTNATDPNAPNNVTVATNTVSGCPPYHIAFSGPATVRCHDARFWRPCRIKARAMLSNESSTATAKQKVRVAFYLSEDPIFDGSDKLLRQKKVVAPAPGKTRSVKLGSDAIGNSDVLGRYVIAVCESDRQVFDGCDRENRTEVVGPLAE